MERPEIYPHKNKPTRYGLFFFSMLAMLLWKLPSFDFLNGLFIVMMSQGTHRGKMWKLLQNVMSVKSICLCAATEKEGNAFFFILFYLKISYKCILAKWESHWRFVKKKKKVSLINIVPRLLAFAIQKKRLEGVQMTTRWNMERHWKVLPRQVACTCFTF